METQTAGPPLFPRMEFHTNTGPTKEPSGYLVTPQKREFPVRWIPQNRHTALANFLLAPLTTPARAMWSIGVSLANIVSFGTVSIWRGTAPRGLVGRCKAVGCSLLSLALTPVSVLVEGISSVSHAIKPGHQKIDDVAAQLWNGFAVLGTQQKRDKDL